jgi:hypothetical protein
MFLLLGAIFILKVRETSQRHEKTPAALDLPVAG